LSGPGAAKSGAIADGKRAKNQNKEMVIMKKIASGLLALGLLAAQIPEANAVVCAAGVYHAGCAGPRGAAVTHRHYGYGGAAVVRPVGRCYYRAGVRVCR
jgi:hypothetical protein